MENTFSSVAPKGLDPSTVIGSDLLSDNKKIGKIIAYDPESGAITATIEDDKFKTLMNETISISSRAPSAIENIKREIDKLSEEDRKQLFSDYGCDNSKCHCKNDN